MQFKLFIFSAAFLLSAIIGGCGLIPDFGGDSMSRADRAILYLQMGVRYLELDKLEPAKENLEKAEHLDSSNPDIYFALGGFYERIKDYTKAQQYYELAARKAPDNFSIKTNLGRFLCDRGDLNRGQALLQEAIAIPMNTSQWFALSGLGLCYLMQKDLVRAEEYFRKALNLNANYGPALMEMQKISYENHQYMSSRAFMERYLAVAKHTPETLWIAFQTERALSNAKAAGDYAEELLSDFPASKEAEDVKTVMDK
jgi:type IV pilus assembly protein PilF